MIRVGMSGWTFAPWRKGFYPKGLTQKKELEYASRRLNTIEVNGTFYSLQRPKSFESWYAQTPSDFVFSVKAPKFITHILRLNDAEEPIANFFASGILALKEKLGPVLWQFPPTVKLKDDRFDKFVKLLPFTRAQAEKLAQRRSDRMEGREWTSARGVRQVRHALEFRHPSFFNADFLAMLRAHGIAVVIAHGGEESLYFDEPTADFVYARMHGEGKPFTKGYPKKTLEKFADQLAEWTKGKRDAYVNFNTEAKVHSPQDAVHLTEILQARKLMPVRSFD